MLSLTTRQQAIIDATYKEVFWQFRVRNNNNTVCHNWGVKDIDADSDAICWYYDQDDVYFAVDNRFEPAVKFGSTLDEITWQGGAFWDKEDDAYDYSFKITDFRGIELNRPMSEMGIQAPSEINFGVTNKDFKYYPDDYRGGQIYIALGANDGSGKQILRRFRFSIKNVEPEYQMLRFTCEDFLQDILKGDYPNTKLIKGLFYTSDADVEDSVCVPEPYGTCYVPLRSVFVPSAVSITATTISTTGTSNGSRCRFTDSGRGFGKFNVGQYITVSGYADTTKNGTFLVLSASPNVLEVSETSGITTGGAGETVTISQSSRYYLLGPSNKTYTLSKVRSPRSWGYKSTWDLTQNDIHWDTGVENEMRLIFDSGYGFFQTTATDGDGNEWKIFNPLIADSNSDGLADSPGLWKQGDVFLDMPTKFSRTDTENLTNPSDIIRIVLSNMGVSAKYLDDNSFKSAADTFDSWGLTWNGAFWYKERKTDTIARLLNMCHSSLVVNEQIELHVLSKTSRKTITNREVLKTQEVGQGSFRYNHHMNVAYSDAGYVAWQEADESQDKFLKVLVGAKGTKTKISGDILEIPWVQNSIHCQKLGQLYYQRKLLSFATAYFSGKSNCLALNPDDVIEINDHNYAGVYNALVSKLTINKDLSLGFECTRYTDSFDDWGDISPAALTIYDDDNTNFWEPPVSGPLSNQDIGKQNFSVWGLPYLIVGPDTNRAPYTDIQIAANSLLESRHSGIYILNGIYRNVHVNLPNKDMDIKGESEGGVFLRNTANQQLFYATDLTKTFNFGTFTIESQNTTHSIKIFDFDGNNNKIKAKFKDVTFNLYNTSTQGASTGDRGISLVSSASGTDVEAGITDCVFRNGEIGIYLYEVKNCMVDSTRFENSTNADISINGCSIFKGNVIISEDFWYKSIWAVSGTGCDDFNLRNFSLFGKAITAGVQQIGVDVNFSEICMIDAGKVKIINTLNDANNPAIGIRVVGS